MDRRSIERLSGFVLFILSLLWFYFPGEYALIANRDQGIFLTTGGFFRSFMDHPGGLLQYTGTFLNQFLQFRLAGSILLAGLAWLGYSACRRLIYRVSDGKNFLCFAPVVPALIVGMHNYYPHQVFHTMGFIVALFLVSLVPESTKKRRIFLVFTVPVLYFVTGGFIWFFCLMVLAVELSGIRKTTPPAVFLDLLLLIILYPVLIAFAGAKLVFLYPVRELFIAPLPLGEEYGRVGWPVLFTGGVLLLILMTRFPAEEYVRRNLRRIIAGSAVSLVSVALILHFTYSRKNAEFFRIEKLAVENEWDGLLQYAAKHPSTNLFGSFYTNLALMNQQKLCSLLFDYPQPFGRRGLCFPWEDKSEILRRGSDFFWSVNFVNEAHHWAYESMIIEGFTRRNLTMLIQTELVRGNFKVAEKYIMLLERSLFEKKIAGSFRKFLDNPETIANDPQLGPKNHAAIEGDFFTDGLDLEKNLKLIISDNPTNKEALDYLMAIFLLEKKVNEIATFAPLYAELNENQIPRLVDEGLMVYVVTHRGGDPPGIQVSQQTVQRFEAYTQVLRRYRDPGQAATALFPEFGNSFWFHLNFNTYSN